MLEARARARTARRGSAVLRQAVARAIAAGTLNGDETLPATMRLQIAGLNLDVNFDGEVKLA